MHVSTQEPGTEQRVDTEKGGRARRRVVMLALGAALVVAGLVSTRVLQRTTGEEPGRPHPELARIEPIRISYAADRLSGDFALGLRRYQSQDWAGAAEALERVAITQARNGELLLYLGSARLLEGDLDQAIPKLVRAVADAPDADTADEARWQLANAQLAAGRADTKLLFEQIVSHGLARSTDARAVLQEMGGK